MLYHFYQRFGDKKKFMKDIISQVFEEQDVNYQDFYYFYEAVFDDFQDTLDVFDWEDSEPEKAKPTLFKKLTKTIKGVRDEIAGLLNIATKRTNLDNEDKRKFKNLILTVLQKNRNLTKYLQSNTTEEKIDKVEEDLVKELVDEYNNDHQDHIISLKPTKS